MLAQEKARRQNELENCIYDLSEKLLEDDCAKREIALKLLELYKNGFRHSYSGFFPIILTISQNDNTYDLDCLSENLESLRAYVEKDYVTGSKEFGILYRRLEKLCDHLNLEIGRLNYYAQNEHKIEDMETKTTTLNEDLRTARVDLEAASKRAASIQTELIAVLSIFAAIVVAFSGGFTFLGSVMTSINEASHYEVVVLVAIICGMVMFNTIFLMMYLVGKITDRNIYARCLTENCSCDNQPLKKCNGLQRIRKRLPYVFYFNLICIIGIVIDCIIWYRDITGKLF